jgi:NAD(P)-dependent dehydrogenase (short-subunit alcohol dehydrogenase family)
MTTKAIYPSLEGRSVLVTGGASGIGAVIVRGLLRNRARVAVLDLDREAGETLAQEFGPEVLFVQCDLTDMASLKPGIAEAERRLGAFRVLVNNAANDQRHKLGEITPELWDASQDVNLRHQFFAAQAVLPGMRASGGGSIINLSSVAWMFGSPELVPYATAKAAVIGLTRSLGVALGADNIRVNAIAPGGVMTEKQMRLWHTPESKARLVGMQAIKRDLLEEDIADAVLFLAADDSRMITKQCLTVDGGLR